MPAQGFHKRHASARAQRFAACLGQYYDSAGPFARSVREPCHRNLRDKRMLRDTRFQFGQREALAIELDDAIKAS